MHPKIRIGQPDAPMEQNKQKTYDKTHDTLPAVTERVS
jgi:hypothetical protein